MSHPGYGPYEQYVPPPQPQYASQQQQEQQGTRKAQHQPQPQPQPQYTPYDPGHSHVTGSSYTTVSSLHTGSSHEGVNYHVSGMGEHGSGHTPGSVQTTHTSAGLHGRRRAATMKSEEPAVFEMSGESIQPSLGREKEEAESRRREAAGAGAGAATEQTLAQANPWPFYLETSPIPPKQDAAVAQKEDDGKKDQQLEPEPVQAFPWPYHGPSTEEDEPRATVHPPMKRTAADEATAGEQSVGIERQDKSLPPAPAEHDVSVLDDILSDMDEQDKRDQAEEDQRAQRPPKDPTLRPPPLNISRLQPGSGTATVDSASGSVSPGGRTYIPYRPAASPTTSSPTTSPPAQQQSHFPLVTAPHHVYMPQTQSTLSPPPQSALSPPPTRPGASQSPNSASPASVGGGFSPYRPPSPHIPLPASSTGTSGLGISSPTGGQGGSPGFTPYHPSPPPSTGRPHAQTHSGLTSPTHPHSPALPPPPQHTPPPRPTASPQPVPPSQLSHALPDEYQRDNAAVVPPYPASPPRIVPSPVAGKPGTSSSHGRSKPASPAPLAFYPPLTTQPTSSHTDAVPRKLASPTAAAALSRPASRNDSGSVHSGVSSATGGAPVHPAHGQHRHPSPTPPSAGGASQYFSPQLSPQPFQHPSQSPNAPSPYSIPQPTYTSPSLSSSHSIASPHPPAPSAPPPQPPRPQVSHATTLPSPGPSPLSPPPPYTAVDLPPRPGSAGASYQSPPSYGHPPMASPQQGSHFPSQPTYAAPSPSQYQQQPTLPSLSPQQNLPPLPPRPSTSHNGRPPPGPRPQQGFGSGPANAMQFPPPPPPPRPNHSTNNHNGVPPPMPPRPHHQASYGSSAHNSNKIFGSSSAKKWLDKTERLVEQTFGDILQPQVDQTYGRGGGGSSGYHYGPGPPGGYGGHPAQPQYVSPPGQQHHSQYPSQPHHSPPPHHHHRPQQPPHGSFPDRGRGRGWR